jgi:hypothetical protein
MKEGEKKGGNGVKNTTIYVTVDTENINEGNIDQNVEFSDDRNDPPQIPGNPKDYVSTISRGMKVYWRGEAKDPDSGDIIEITGVNVKEKNGSWKLLDGVDSEPGNKGVKVGRVKGQYIKEEEPYSVRFRIEGRKSEFEVDPKLVMESTHR